MFRTKSLSNKDMKSLIQKSKSSAIEKENRNYSLRSLIADKTIQYQRHMETLIKETNQIVYSSKKKQMKSTPRKFLENNANIFEKGGHVRQFDCGGPSSNLQSIKQFDEFQNYIRSQSMPTYYNQQTISQTDNMESFSFLDSNQQASQSRENKTAFKINLQNEQLNEENRQLRRQIEALQQRLETTQLIRIQKQSQSESLRLKLKIVQLKLEQLEQKVAQKSKTYLKFGPVRMKNISISQISRQSIDTQAQRNFFEEGSVQTDMRIEDIQNIVSQSEYQGLRLDEVIRQRKFTESLMLQKFSIIGGRQIAGQSLGDMKTYQLLQKLLMEGEDLKKQELNRKEQQFGIQKKKYEQKINSLVKMLGLAENEIRGLLSKIRQVKSHDVANYKQMLASHRLRQ